MKIGDVIKWTNNEYFYITHLGNSDIGTKITGLWLIKPNNLSVEVIHLTHTDIFRSHAIENIDNTTQFILKYVDSN
jgi:hypothetical protein